MKRVLFACALAVSLAACTGDEKASAPRLADVATFEVGAAQGLPARGWDGVVEAVRTTDLAAQTSGRVTAVEVDVNDRVEQGDVLLRITAVEQDAGANAARAQLRAAEASAAEAEQTYRRYVALANGQFVSKLQLDQARATRDAARANLAQAAQQAGYTVVRAPFDGVVAARDVEPGETVTPGQPLMRVYEPRELRIEVAVPQTRAEAIRRDPRARVFLPGNREIVSAEVIVFPAADAASHSVNVRVRLPDLDPVLAPGTTAKVVFDATAAEASAGTVRIPASPVAQRGELSAVYVKRGDRLLLRQLRLGARVGDSVEVISGLQPGELVARDPVAALQALEAQRKAAGAGHE